MLIIRIALPLFIALLLSGCYKPESESYPLGHEKNPVVMAFVPSTEADQVIASGEELCLLLNEQTDMAYKAYVATSYAGIVEAMAVGKVHVGWLPPMAYVLASQRNGDKVILKVVRNGKDTYRGQILVGADSEINSVADLQGRLVAFADQASTSGHLYPRALLRDNGFDPNEDESYYAGGHDTAVISLIKGKAEAACCYEDVRDKLIEQYPDIMQTTRVLAYTERIPADNVTVIKDLDQAIVDSLIAGLLALLADEHGRQVLDELYKVEGLTAATDADYAPVREMAQLLELDVEAEVNKL